MALPGLSFEIVRSAGPALGIRADRTAILALTERGPEEVPTLVHSAEDFVAQFGLPVDGMLGPLAAEAYFKNGGTALVVVRFLPRRRNATDATDGVAVPANGTLGLVGATDGSLVLRIRAKDSGAYANRITVEAVPTLRKRVRGTVVPGATPEPNQFVVTDLSNPYFDKAADLDLPIRLLAHESALPQARVERWGRVKSVETELAGSTLTQKLELTGNILNGTNGLAILEVYEPSFTLKIREPTRADILVTGIDLRFIEQANQKLDSARIGLELSAVLDHPELPKADVVVRLANGVDGLANADSPDLLDCMRASFLRALDALQGGDFADVVMAPDLWSRVFRTKGVLRLAFDATIATELSDQMVLAAERSRDRVVLIDPPLVGVHELRPLGVEELERWRTERMNQLVSARDFAASYAPWVRIVAGPLFKGDDTMIIPPSPFVAGRMALTARLRGPWVATGNIALEGVVGLEQSLDIADEERLQDIGLNPLRMMLPRGATIQGVRSLSWPDRTAWRFLSTRRLFNFLRRALRPIGLSYAFEPNAPPTWMKLRRDIERLLRDMYAHNAFAGAQPESAFFVKIDDQLNPEDARGNGVLTAMIGVAPALPLEFLVIRLIVGRGLVDVTEEPILR